MKINQISILQQLVKCKSITPEDDNALAITKTILESLGFIVEIIEFTEKNTYPVKNMYAKLGTGNNYLMFCGHLDVVPEGDKKAWSSPPFAAEIKDNAIFGRGTEDMKGGIACFIAALSNIKDSINLKENSVAVLLTLDEEKLAINGIKKLLKYVILDKKQNINECLLGEPTCINYVGDCIKIGRRGSLNFTITINGKQGHVAYPSLFINPVDDANTTITNLTNINLSKTSNYFEKSNLEVTSVNTSSDVYNIVPKEIIIKGNVRFNDSYSLDYIKRQIKDSIKDCSTAEVEFMSDASTPFVNNTESKLYLCLENAIARVTNKRPSNNTFGGTSDARFIKDYMPVIEFGLLEKTLHQVNENVKLEDLQTLTNIYTAFLKEYFNIS